MGYRHIARVTVQHNGLPIHLKLQERTEVPPEPFYCLTWRTVYPGSGRNRRFYRSTTTGFWTIPVQVALHLMSEADERGWLDGGYEDRQVRHCGTDNDISYSRSLNARKRRTMFESIMCDEGEPDWGDDPVFIIIQVPDGQWRKIMIVDTTREFCTFRSTTMDVGYRLGMADPRLHPWRMDNAMQDASAEMIREFLRVLNTEV